MLISVGENLDGYKIVENKGIVIGIGNSSSDGKAYREAAINKLSEAAERTGANAVIDVKLMINPVLGSTVEATAYGNAVILESVKESNNPSKREKIDYDKFIISNIEKEFSEPARLVDMNGFKFVICPKCKSKYKADIDDKGKLHIKGFDDVDNNEPGLQVYCIRCGAKFTVPDKI